MLNTDSQVCFCRCKTQRHSVPSAFDSGFTVAWSVKLLSGVNSKFGVSLSGQFGTDPVGVAVSSAILLRFRRCRVARQSVDLRGGVDGDSPKV